MMKHIIVSSALMFGLLGCAQNSTYQSGRSEETSGNSQSNSLITVNYKAADVLTAQLNGKLNPAQPLIVATLVNIDDLNNSSTFGRLTSEQVSATYRKNRALIFISFWFVFSNFEFTITIDPQY
ncbi:MAG: FlgO family outer membrane protein [Methylotenera sp.]